MADKIDQIALMETWKSAVTLRDATDVFGAIREAKIKREARQKAVANTAILKTNLKTGEANWDAACDGFATGLASLNERANSQIARMDSLLERLRSGDLVAVGFAATATAEEGPSRVPIHLMEPRFIKLAKNEIRSEHFHFRQVRIAFRQPVGNETLISPARELAAKRGPAPAGDIIRQIHSDLIRSGEIPPKHTLKQAWGIVVDRINRDHPEQFKGKRGLSYSSFARHINGQ